VAVVLFAAVAVTAYMLNRQKEAEAAEPAPTSATTFVFTDQDGLPTSIEVKPADGETVRVVKNADNQWALELPEKAEADQGLAEAAASQVKSLRVLGDMDLAPDVLGLDKPSYIITIEFTGGTKHVLDVGDNTPTNNGYYVRVDGQKTVIVSLSGIDSLVNLAMVPPYLNTPTPSPLPPTETPTPQAETSTPIPSPTVTPTP
jgi:hypothetical protein